MATLELIISDKIYKSTYNIKRNLNILPINKISEFSISGNLPSGEGIRNPRYGKSKIVITDPDNEPYTISEVDNGGGGGYYILKKNGVYTLKYTGENIATAAQGANISDKKFPYSFYYTFAVVENKNPLKKWTITDVINRTLDLAEPLRKGEKSRFKLQGKKWDGTILPNTQADKFNKILSPQFAFTKQTLRECLQEVGKVIHGEPRLSIQKDEDGYFYEVSYDMYAGQEESNLNFMPYTSKSSQHVIENYTAWLDSNAENLVNQLDKYSGVIVEPYDGGAKSVRTENMYVRIEESNMLIPTQYPIYSVEKLEYVYVDGSTVKSVDITSWLFEKSVYDTQLQSYTEQYPYSKAYGLYYQQGAKNIGGLNFKVDKAAFAAFTNYAIINILRQALNNTKYSVSEYPTMSFRVTYTPFYNARVAQTKSYYKDFMRPAALIYNQSANVIESRYFGENLKGAVARLGNVDLSLTYVMKWLDQIPKAGQMFNRDYYISTVAVEMLPTYIRCTVGLSKDFNRISEYIGINSERRYSEISQTQAVERNTLYREYIVVGKQEQSDSDCLIGDKMLKSISGVFGANYMGEGTFNYGEYEIGYLDGEHEDIKFFNGYDLDAQYAVDVDGKLYAARARAELNDDGDGGSILTHFYIRISNLSPSVAPSGTGKIYQNYYLPLTNVCAWGTSYQGNNAGGAVNLPVISSAFGNSVSFSWKYADNYSAGAASLKKDNAIESGKNKITGYFQGDQPYTDYYGRIFYYDFDLQEKGQTLYNTNLAEITQKLPQGTKPAGSSGYVSTVGKTPYILRKDNREALQVNFQIDFVTNLDNLIIGSALASYCPAVRGSDIKLVAKLYVFETELNKFTDHIEAYEDEKLKDIPSVPITVNFGNGYFTVEAEAFPKSGKSWAIVTNQYEKPSKEVEDEFGNITTQHEIMGGDLLIGQNIEVTAGQAFTPIYFTKKREIFDKSVWTDKR